MIIRKCKQIYFSDDLWHLVSVQGASRQIGVYFGGYKQPTASLRPLEGAVTSIFTLNLATG